MSPKTAVDLSQRGQVIHGQVPHERPMGVAMDGGMMNIRQEGWKELKVSTVFEIAQRWESDPVTQEKRRQAYAVENSYVAVLGGPAHFGRVLWSEVVRREFPEAGDSMALGDGATWIWNLAGEHLVAVGKWWIGITRNTISIKRGISSLVKAATWLPWQGQEKRRQRRLRVPASHHWSGWPLASDGVVIERRC